MMKPVLILPLMLATAIFFSCGEKKVTQSAANDEVRIPVTLTGVDSTDRAEPVFAAGTVASLQEARLSFKTGGIIGKIYVREGQQVRKGQLLAILDLTEINAQVAQARVSHEKAERDMNRLRSMLDDTAATLEQFQNAATGFDVARQNLSMAEFNLSHSRILSPVDGAYTRMFITEGVVTGPGWVLLVVSSGRKSDWVVRVGVSDRDWGRLAKGDKALLTLDAYPGQSFSGRVSEIAQSADAATRLYEVEIRLDPTEKRLASGLFAKAELFPAVSGKYRVIPVEALIEGHGKEGFVFVSGNGIARKIPVTIGYLDGKNVLITGGLDSITTVITSGSAFLTDSAQIQIEGSNDKRP